MTRRWRTAEALRSGRACGAVSCSTRLISSTASARHVRSWGRRAGDTTTMMSISRSWKVYRFFNARGEQQHVSGRDMRGRCNNADMSARGLQQPRSTRATEVLLCQVPADCGTGHPGGASSFGCSSAKGRTALEDEAADLPFVWCKLYVGRPLEPDMRRVRREEQRVFAQEGEGRRRAFVERDRGQEVV